MRHQTQKIDAIRIHLKIKKKKQTILPLLSKIHPTEYRKIAPTTQTAIKCI